MMFPFSRGACGCLIAPSPVGGQPRGLVLAAGDASYRAWSYGASNRWPCPVAYAPPDEKRLWAKLRRVVARVPFAEDLVAAYYCALDRDTPGYVRAVLFGALAYFVLPTDMVPDFLAGLGFTDDASVIAAAIAAVGRHSSPGIASRRAERLERLAR